MDLKELTKRLAPFFKERNVNRAFVFGSAARGTLSRHSDVDLMIVLETDKRFFDRYADFEGIHDKLPGRHVDLLIYTPEELDAISHRTFIRSILQEGKLIYEY